MPRDVCSSVLLADEEPEGLAVAVGALADHTMRDDIRDHAVAAPLLALLDVREMNLDYRHLEQLERVADRIAVVAPRARVEDQPVDVVVRVVDPFDELALAVRLPAAGADVEGVRPLVDLRLELIHAHAAVELRVAAPDHIEVDAVEDQDLHQRLITR